MVDVINRGLAPGDRSADSAYDGAGKINLKFAAVDAAITAVSTSALPKAGGVMTGPIELAADPAAAMQAVTKQYVDGLVAAQDWVKLSSGAVTAQAGIDVALPAGYSAFKLKFRDVVPGAAGGQALAARVSYDGGSTFLSSSGAYVWVTNYTNLTTTGRFGSDMGDSTSMGLSAVGQLETGADTAEGVLEINPGGTGRPFGLHFTSAVKRAADFSHAVGSGRPVSTNGRATHISLRYGAGTITGSYDLWGVK